MKKLFTTRKLILFLTCLFTTASLYAAAGNCKSFVEKVSDLEDDRINAFPTDLLLSDTAFFENISNPFIGSFTAVDQDLADSFVYSLENGTGDADNTLFSISGANLFFKETANFEEKKTYSIRCRVTDSDGLLFEKQFTISIKDTFDIPTGIFLSNTALPENVPVNTFIGVLSTEDANFPKPDKYIYSLISGEGSADNSRFRISNDSLYTNQEFDFESRNKFIIRVKTALPNGMSAEKVFSISITDVNLAPTLITLESNEGHENSFFVSEIETTDPEGGGKFIYSLVPGEGSEDNELFRISEYNGVYYVASLDWTNYEVKNTNNIRIRATDEGGLFLEMPFVIKIIDNNDPPNIHIPDIQVSESTPVNTILGTVSCEDEDGTHRYKFSIEKESSFGSVDAFSIDSATGVLRLVKPLDYETENGYYMLIYVVDFGKNIVSTTRYVTVAVLDYIDEFFPSSDMVTPNGDGKNDTWKIQNVGLYKDYSLQIVDEYSQLIYSVDNNYDNSWDATYNGKVLPSGVYYYVFKSNTDNNLYKGFITVVK